MVDETVDSKDNLEEKAKEVADIRMYHFSKNFLRLGRDMLWWWWFKWELFIFSTCLTTFSTCKLVVDDTVDGKNKLEEMTREVADIRMYHFDKNFLQLGRDML